MQGAEDGAAFADEDGAATDEVALDFTAAIAVIASCSPDALSRQVTLTFWFAFRCATSATALPSAGADDICPWASRKVTIFVAAS